MALARTLLQVALLTLSSQSLVDGSSCFDEYGGKQLTTFVKKIEGKSEEECRGRCLTYPEYCQSVQYDKTTKNCYINVETHLSKPALYKNNDKYVYWYRRRECQPNCYFVYFYKRYLLNHNDKRLLSYSTAKCMESCLLNQDFDCKSIDYNRPGEECTLSKESKDTQPSLWKTHHILEHFHKVCKPDIIEETPCYEEKMAGRYLNFPAKTVKNIDVGGCQRRCFTATFPCKSINYNKKTKVCHLNKETFETKPNWVKFDNNFDYWRRSEHCDIKCRFVYNYRTYIQGHILHQNNDYTSLQCMADCYQDNKCKSYDYDSKKKICVLHSESKITRPNAAKYSLSWENFHKVCETKKVYPCFDTYENFYMNDKYTPYPKKSEKECIDLCLYGSIPCSSISYNSKTKICYVSRKTKTSHPNLYKPSKDYIYYEKQSECRRDCVVMPFPSYYIKNHNLRTYTVKDEMHCVEKCLLEKPKGSCKSVSYNKKSKICYLHDESRLTAPSDFYQNEAYNHWHISCHDSYCFREYPFRYLTAQHYKTYSDSTEYSCKTICLKSEGCKSAYYDTMQNKCYLSKETRLTKPNFYKSHNNMVYWEREAICKPTCYMKEYDNRYIQGRNTKTIQSHSALECKQLCLTEQSFDCKSVEYNKRSKACYLSTENRQSVPTLWRTSSQYTYYEKECGRSYPCFNKYNQKYLQNKHYKTINGVSEEQCAYECEYAHCKSASYNSFSRVCYLSKFTKSEHPSSYKSHSLFVYLEKKAECKPNCFYRKYFNRYLSGMNDLTKTVKNEKECIMLCMKNRNWCKSVDYLKIAKRCYLSKKTQADGNGLATNFMYNHYEHTCEEDGDDKPCFTLQKRRYIPGSTKKTLQGQTEKSCLQACILANFQCRSVEYNPSTKACYLSEENKHSKLLLPHPKLNYYHRKPECTRECPIKTYAKKVLAGFNFRTISTSNDYDCLVECLTTKECKSVERHRLTKRCFLQKETKNTKSAFFRNHNYYTYWHMAC